VSVIIDSEATLETGIAALAAADPVMARIAASVERPRLRRTDPGFHGLVAIIVSQQLSTASADAIFGRLTGRYPAVEPADILSASDEDLRAVGLSGPKIRTLRHAAAAALDLDLAGLAALGADEAHAKLIAIKGIGPWTADSYLLACLGHADAFPAGDLALQEAARLAVGLAERPNVKDLEAMAERWRPWRAVAARLLWSYYRAVKQGRGGAPLGQ
jgi:DNA-3-methyladenine glycosylase II